MKRYTYHFQEVEHCNFCNAPTSKAKVLGKRLNQSQGLFPSKKIGITTTIMQCSHCKLVFPNPIPFPDTLSQHYDIPPDSYWKPQYFEINIQYFKNQITQFQKLTNKKEGKVLDIGSGIGKALIALENAGYEAFGIEPSPPFYQKAIEKMNIKPEKLQCLSIEEAEYEPNTFDWIIFGAVFEHLYKPSEALLKAINWLKPNGLIHIEVPSSNYFLSSLINFLHKIRGSDYVSHLSPMHVPFHIYEFRLSTFQLHSQLHNYSIRHSILYPCTCYFPPFLDYFAKQWMKLTNTGMQLEVWLQKKSSLP